MSSSGALISMTPREGMRPSESGSSALDFWSGRDQRAVGKARADATWMNNAAYFRFEFLADGIEKIREAGIVGRFPYADAAYVCVAQIREKTLDMFIGGQDLIITQMTPDC
jgi:hypothetical protein